MKAARSARTRASVASPAAASTALMKPHLPAQRKPARTQHSHIIPTPPPPLSFPAGRPHSKRTQTQTRAHPG